MAEFVVDLLEFVHVQNQQIQLLRRAHAAGKTVEQLGAVVQARQRVERNQRFLRVHIRQQGGERRAHAQNGDIVLLQQTDDEDRKRKPGDDQQPPAPRVIFPFESHIQRADGGKTDIKKQQKLLTEMQRGQIDVMAGFIQRIKNACRGGSQNQRNQHKQGKRRVKPERSFLGDL